MSVFYLFFKLYLFVISEKGYLIGVDVAYILYHIAKNDSCSWKFGVILSLTSKFAMLKEDVSIDFGGNERK